MIDYFKKPENLDLLFLMILKPLDYEITEYVNTIIIYLLFIDLFNRFNKLKNF